MGTNFSKQPFKKLEIKYYSTVFQHGRVISLVTTKLDNKINIISLTKPKEKKVV